MDNGPALRVDAANKLRDSSATVGDMIEVSMFRREVIVFFIYHTLN